ncbi:penicillin-binding protein [Streptomyces sp. RKND-216]|uniref:transglycosylase domain-containing protein n=1 Tax=Streptomyces sp. RKND-216 TaxID=2562581 RepID=UPI00109DAD6D|nr:transglycosylase domain-containing protein [Streptomyces sp. RKND-216]THA25486.1 penicillin-binding protein [Streptomyces sp. RKND-216]
MSEHRRKPPQGRGRRAQQPPQAPQGRRAAPPNQATSRAYGAGPDGMTPGPPGGYAGHRSGGRDETLVGAPRPGGRAEARRAAQRGGKRRAASAGAAAGAAVGGRAAARQRARTMQHEDKKRFIDYPRSGKYGWRRWTPSWKQWLGTFVGFCALMLGLAGVAYAMVEVPDVKNVDATSESNVYYWSDGSRMVDHGTGKNRQVISFDEIPETMKDAVISAENETFYEDSGVSPVGIARAAFKMATGGQTQSGSTITQQYVKNTYLNQDQTLTRKVKELLISIKVDAQLEKQEILAGYLNTAYYGRGAYGIQAASQAYYGKNAEELDRSEAAFMASLLNGPNLHDPAGGEAQAISPAQAPEKNQARAEQRWSWILKRQVETGEISKSKRQELLAKKFPDPKEPERASSLEGQIGYLVELANNDVLNNPDSTLTKKQLDDGGYQIYTTFDKKKVQALEKTVQKVRKDNLKPDKREEDKFVQFGGASVRPEDGAIVAVYGGTSATEHFRSNAGRTGAGVGSTFKPYVMAAALENGVRDPELGEDQGPEDRIEVSPKTVYDGDSKIKLLDYDGETWLNGDGEPQYTPNEGDTDYEEITLREAMKVSANTPFIQLAMDVGLEEVKEAALDAGVSERGLMENPTPAFALGISSPTAVEMANGYATFANSGLQNDTYAVKEVKDGSKRVYQHNPGQKRAFDPSTADTVTDMLVDVVKDGTGTAVMDYMGTRPVAGKTGTTDGNKQAWFTGYTPQLSTSIGMWRSDPAHPEFLEMYGTAGKPTIHGASFPAEIWGSYMGKALEGKEQLPFPEAPPITAEEYCAHGACPTESPEPSPSPSESNPTPSPSVPTTPSPSVTPSPTGSCDKWWGCDDEGTTTGPGGGQDGGTDQGTTGGTDQGTTGGTDQGTTGGDDGGIFGGPDNDTRGRVQEE